MRDGNNDEIVIWEQLEYFSQEINGSEKSKVQSSSNSISQFYTSFIIMSMLWNTKYRIPWKVYHKHKMDKSKKALEIIPHLILFIDTEELNTHGTTFSFVNRNEPSGKFGSWTWWFRCKRRRNLITCWLEMMTKRTFWLFFLSFFL